MNRKFDSSSGIYFGKLIFLNVPLYIKIEDLDYQSIHSFSLPHISMRQYLFSKDKFDLNDFVFLLGMDIIKDLCVLSSPQETPALSIFPRREDKLVVEKGFVLYDKYLEDFNKILGELKEMDSFGLLKNISFRILHELNKTGVKIPSEYVFTLKRNCSFLHITTPSINNNQFIAEYLKTYSEYDGIIYKDEEYHRTVIFFKDSSSCLRPRKNKDKIASLKSSVCGFGVIMI